MSAAINRGLWVVMIATLLTSMRHVAEAFLSLEKAGTGAIWGWIPALAIDGGLLFSAWKLRSDKSNRLLAVGFWIFLIVSAFANVDNALKNLGFVFVEHWLWLLAKVALFAGSLPLLVAMMVEVNAEGAGAPQLATAGQSANSKLGNSPDVKVANAPPKLANSKRKSRARLANPRAANRQLSANNDVEELSFDAADKLATWQPANSEPLRGAPLSISKLDDDLERAVITYQQQGSYAKAARVLDLTSEGVRQQVIRAYQQDPVWVSDILPADKLPTT